MSGYRVINHLGIRCIVDPEGQILSAEAIVELLNTFLKERRQDDELHRFHQVQDAKRS